MRHSERDGRIFKAEENNLPENEMELGAFEVEV